MWQFRPLRPLSFAALFHQPVGHQVVRGLDSTTKAALVGRTFLPRAMSPVVPGDGRWPTAHAETAAQASETGVRRDPVETCLDELMRRPRALLDLFTDDVLPSVDHSQKKNSGGTRRPRASEAILEEAEEVEVANHLDEDDDTAEPYLDDEENCLATEDVVSKC